LPVVALALAVLVVTAAPAQEFGWTISASSTDPFVHRASPSRTPASADLYLWLYCAWTFGGLEGLEAGVGGSLALQEVTPLNGCWSASTPTELLLAAPNCPYGPVLIARLTVLDPGGGGTFYLVPSSNNRILSVPCSGTASTAWIGFASDGSVPLYEGVGCSGDQSCLCNPPVPPTAVGGDVGGSTWGRVKGLYR
jgi:hypothetical protein